MVANRLKSMMLTLVTFDLFSHTAAMCFTNKSVSEIVCVTSYEDNTIPNILSNLMSRARIPEVQLCAAKCMTFIHRAGTLSSTDTRIVFRTLPCLARLCSKEFDEEIRATAAETLAYLAEVASYDTIYYI